MASELENEVKESIVDVVDNIYDSTTPPEVLIQPLKPKIELKEEKAMEKQARFKVLSAEQLATIRAQVLADVIEITEQTLEMAESAVKELVTDPAQQYEILSYVEKKLASEGIDTEFDKPEIKVEAAETEKKATAGSLRDRIKGLLEE